MTGIQRGTQFTTQDLVMETFQNPKTRAPFRKTWAKGLLIVVYSIHVKTGVIVDISHNNCISSDCFMCYFNFMLQIWKLGYLTNNSIELNNISYIFNTRYEFYYHCLVIFVTNACI